MSNHFSFLGVRLPLYLFHFLLISSLAIVFFVTNIPFAFLFLSWGSDFHNTDESVTTKYKIFQYNTGTKEQVIGFATLPSSQLKDDEYISLDYEEEDDKVSQQTITLISNVGTIEYECKGNCYCEHEEEFSSKRRYGAASTIRKSVTFFVVALSSLVAFQKAQQHYDTKCVEYMSDSCPENSVRSEVDTCDPLRSVSGTDPLGAQSGGWSTAKEYLGGESPNQAPKWKYFCGGGCFINTAVYTDKSHMRFKDMAEKYGCESIEGHSTVDLPSMGVGDDPFSDEILKVAKIEFQIWLEKFCLKQPRWWAWTNIKMQLKFTDFNNSKDPRLCQGTDKNGRNKTIKCEFVGPNLK